MLSLNLPAQFRIDVKRSLIVVNILGVSGEIISSSSRSLINLAIDLDSKGHFTKII
jgi:hypothetical protein